MTASGTFWRPATIWQWFLTVIAAVLFMAVLMVGYYVVNPGGFGALASMAAYAAVVFPVIFLLSALVAAVLAAVAYWSAARLACTGFGLTALLVLLMAAGPTLGMWSMAKKQNVAVSLVSHFEMETHAKEFPSRVIRDVVYGKSADGTELLLDIWPATGPAQNAPRPAFVRVHGGAWIHGAKSELPAWDPWLNDLGYAVFDVEYRMPPPVRWKDEVGDVKCALGWVFTNAAKLGVDPTRISLTGYSAGGNLAMLAAYSGDSSDLSASCDSPKVPIKSVINFYGPPDLQGLYVDSPSSDYVRATCHQYVGGSPTQFPERYRALSPLSYINAKTPPTITVLGLSDRIVQKEQAEKLDQALTAAGVTHETYLLPGVDHGFDANWGSIATQFTREKIRAFIEKNS
ncbi:MAG TPA: alpha/beta hydrolase [Stellaceae bacterium]|nr:alpha/beta hydrolase [Stellaceae bacterium]